MEDCFYLYRIKGNCILLRKNSSFKKLPHPNVKKLSNVKLQTGAISLWIEINSSNFHHQSTYFLKTFQIMRHLMRLYIICNFRTNPPPITENRLKDNFWNTHQKVNLFTSKVGFSKNARLKRHTFKGVLTVSANPACTVRVQQKISRVLTVGWMNAVPSQSAECRATCPRTQIGPLHLRQKLDSGPVPRPLLLSHLLLYCGAAECVTIITVVHKHYTTAQRTRRAG